MIGIPVSPDAKRKHFYMSEDARQVCIVCGQPSHDPEHLTFNDLGIAVDNKKRPRMFRLGNVSANEEDTEG